MPKQNNGSMCTRPIGGKLRLEALHLDPATVARDEPLIMRDLERVCTTCGSKRRCVRDFIRHPDDAAWREYCPNALTLDALKEAPAGEESTGNCAESMSKTAA